MKDITSYMLIALAMMAFLIPACVLGDTTLAAGIGHVVQIDKDMGMWTWGGNQWGQLSLGHNTDQVSQILLTGLPYPLII
jgi:alpha-tubulin suppressor-like RCC1 family protein